MSMIFSYTDAQVASICLHKVGNKTANEGIRFSRQALVLQDEMKDILLSYFMKSFHTEELYAFAHDSEISMNEVYRYCSEIFQSPACLHEQSVRLAKHLYNTSTHPKIKIGEFYVVYFKNCLLDHQPVDAIGLFKSENKDTFLKIYPKGENFEIASEKGININKLDKGCLVFNTECEWGYVAAIVDNTNKGAEAKYWTDHFLHVRTRKDNYSQTQHMLSMCKHFVAQLPKEDGKLKKAVYMNRSVKALQEEAVNLDCFAEEVFETPQLAAAFKRYKDTYQAERAVEIDHSFHTDSKAVKRTALGTMTTIKLDKNFDISIHGGEQYITRGYDEERKMHYYQLFFKEER